MALSQGSDKAKRGAQKWAAANAGSKSPATKPSGIPDWYAGLHSGFRGQVPSRFNMAEVCSRRWAANPATADQTAVIASTPDQPAMHHSYAELQRCANRLSNALAALGVERGDRVAIVLDGEAFVGLITRSDLINHLSLNRRG